MAAKLIHHHLQSLPCCSQGRGQWLYAAQFEGGMVKVGATRNPRTRARQLQRQVGRLISAIQVRKLAQDCRLYEEERAAIARVSSFAVPVPGRREFFQGLAFADAVGALQPARVD